MKLFPVVSLCAVASVLSQEFRSPADGTVLYRGEQFTAHFVLPHSLETCQEVGVTLAIAHCSDNCPQPSQELGYVLDAGPWNLTADNPDGVSMDFYQDFILHVPELIPIGPAILTLTNFCLFGPKPYPHLEFHNVSVEIGQGR